MSPGAQHQRVGTRNSLETCLDAPSLLSSNNQVTSGARDDPVFPHFPVLAGQPLSLDPESDLS